MGRDPRTTFSRSVVAGVSAHEKVFGAVRVVTEAETRAWQMTQEVDDRVVPVAEWHR